MPDFFVNAASHRPIACLAPATDSASRIAALAQSGCGGVRVRLHPDDADYPGLIRMVDSACAAHSLSWWLGVEQPTVSPALLTRTMEVGAGGAVGAWERCGAEQEWIAACAVPVGERGPRWSEAIDLLSSEGGGPESWNAPSRFFLFYRGEQRSFWPAESDTDEMLDALERIAAITGRSRAWRGLWLDTGDVNFHFAQESPTFPYSASLASKFEEVTQRSFSAALPSLIADTGPTAVVDRLAFWRAAFRSAESEFWRPVRAACDERSVDFVVGCVVDKASAMEVRWGKMLRRYAHRVSVVPADIGERDNSLSIRRAASRAALDDTCPPYMESGVQGRALCSGATQTVVPESLALSPEINVYAANFGALADWGKSGARTALLWPTRSFRLHYNPRAHRLVRWVEEDMLRTAHYLETLHFDFLLLPGGDLEAARVEEARPGDFDGGQAGRTFLRCGRAAHKFDMRCFHVIRRLAAAQ